MALLVPSASQCWSIAGPIVAVVVVIWVMRNSTRIVETLFPQLEWERRLGWLNARADRRANQILHGLQHLLHLFLLVMLAGELTFAWLAGNPDTASSAGLLTLAGTYVYMGVCLSPWIYYFVVVLGPRLQAEFEEQELARYRAENPDIDEEVRKTRESANPSRITLWESTRPRRF
jgi:hypothetical protein